MCQRLTETWPRVVHADRLVVVAVLEKRRVAPGVAEIVFGAGAEGGGELLAVDEELLVALAPPAAAGIPHVQHHAAEAALALGLEHRPVDLSSLRVLRQERVPVPLGVEPPETVDGFRQRGVADREPDRPLLVSVVGDLDLGPFPERHVPAAEEARIGHSQREGLILVCAGGRAEEIAQRGPHARLRSRHPSTCAGSAREGCRGRPATQAGPGSHRSR